MKIFQYKTSLQNSATVVLHTHSKEIESIYVLFKFFWARIPDVPYLNLKAPKYLQLFFETFLNEKLACTTYNIKLFYKTNDDC